MVMLFFGVNEEGEKLPISGLICTSFIATNSEPVTPILGFYIKSKHIL